MTDHHSNLRVRFYPNSGAWMCVVQRMGPDGMPEGDDLVSAVAPTRDDALARALDATEDPEVQEALRMAHA